MTDDNFTKFLYDGNEALARGAYESGVRMATGYPGTPCTGIIDSINKNFQAIHHEWATNEKVALEVAIGSSFAGYRTLAVMKTVGLNVAHDALIAVAQSQINGGIVLAVADDVGRSPSDDLNDCRYYGDSAGIPILEPSDSQEAKDYTKVAFEISEKYSLPVILRLTSVLCKTKNIVIVDENYEYEAKKRRKYTHSCYGVISATVTLGMLGSDKNSVSRLKHDFVGSLSELSSQSNDMEINTLELNSERIGVVTSGVPYNYVKEIMPNASILKLGMINPIPEKLLFKLSNYVDKLYVIEDGQKVLEKNIKSHGIHVIGEELFPKFPIMTRFTPDIISEKLLLKKTKQSVVAEVPFRLPLNCAGCSHLFIYYILKKHKIRATTDVTCGGLGVLPHIDAFCSAKCMGSSIGIAHGYNTVSTNNDKLVAVIGDGGFWATGINNLINLSYNNGSSVVIIVDNSCIAMTGGQDLPSGHCGQHADKSKKHIRIDKLCHAIGVENVVTVDPYAVDKLESLILDALKATASTVIIAKRKCLVRFKPKKVGTCQINSEKCTKCRACLNIGCPAIGQNNSDNFDMFINQSLCVGCKLCMNFCKNKAISYVKK